MSAANSSTALEPDCEPLPSWGFWLGVGMGVIGSIGINVGQNFQAEAMQQLPPEERGNPCSSTLWIKGQVVFSSFSLINFAALALAPASVLTPLESIQFVSNIVYNRLVHKATITPRMASGVGLACFGTTLTVVFGASGEGCHSIEQLESFWIKWTWPLYASLSLLIAAAAFVTHRTLRRRLTAGETMPAHASLVLPFSYTIYSALIGGAQMIVHSKVISELLAMLVQGQYTIFIGWIVYVELFLLIVCGFIWLYKLTECLGMYDPLLILPLMVGTYILFGGIAGGIFFQEFERLHEGFAGWYAWAFYSVGLLCVLGGLGLIAIASIELDHAKSAAEGGDAAAVDPGKKRPAPVLAPEDTDSFTRANARSSWLGATPKLSREFGLPAPDSRRWAHEMPIPAARLTIGTPQPNPRQMSSNARLSRERGRQSFFWPRSPWVAEDLRDVQEGEPVSPSFAIREKTRRHSDPERLSSRASSPALFAEPRPPSRPSSPGPRGAMMGSAPPASATKGSRVDLETSKEPQPKKLLNFFLLDA